MMFERAGSRGVVVGQVRTDSTVLVTPLPRRCAGCGGVHCVLVNRWGETRCWNCDQARVAAGHRGVPVCL